MTSDVAAIERALVDLASSVTARVQSMGWARRDLDSSSVLVLTRPIHGDVFVAAELDRSTFSRWPVRWPELLELRFGVGYEPALGLMPLVTLRPSAALIDEPGATKLTFELRDAAGGPTVAAGIADVISDHSVEFAKGYDIDRFDAELQRQELEPELRPLLLAAAGRRDQARRLLDRYVAEQIDDTDELGPRRFARQLHRWLDAGSLPIPAVEQTLSRLPRAATSHRASPAQARRHYRDRQAARKAVRSAAIGKTPDELAALLAHEYESRGLVAAPSALAMDVEMIELARQPFGRARAVIRALRMIKAAASDGIDLRRDHTLPNPDWLQPPPNASYPINPGRRYAAVDIDPGAVGLLVRASVEATRRIGPVVLLDAWLNRAPDYPSDFVSVHLGQQMVGTLPAQAAHAFDQDLTTAAELFDEKPLVPCRLIRTSRDAAPILEVPLPDDTNI